ETRFLCKFHVLQELGGRDLFVGRMESDDRHLSILTVASRIVEAQVSPPCWVWPTSARRKPGKSGSSGKAERRMFAPSFPFTRRGGDRAGLSAPAGADDGPDERPRSRRELPRGHG